MKFPKITIGVTVKNSAVTIKKCVDSLLSVDYPNKEIIITDAFSTDGTWDILQRYGKKIKSFRVDGNVSVGRNAIVRQAGGELIAFTDSDCFAEKDWLKNLVKAFENPDVVSAGGSVLTPIGATDFQKLIGRELEDRYKNFPSNVSRLPFMNICVRAAAARKNLLDESLAAGEDADFGYRITQRGKMIFIPGAKVFHNHRPTLKSFLRQQFSYGKYMPLLYRKFFGRAGGDHISKPTMIIQPFLFLTGFLLLLLAHVFPDMTKFSAILFSMLGIIYTYDSARLSESILDFMKYIMIFFLRTVAWSAGMIIGLKYLVREK